jgi:hypothetical protein
MHILMILEAYLHAYLCIFQSYESLSLVITLYQLDFNALIFYEYTIHLLD